MRIISIVYRYLTLLTVICLVFSIFFACGFLDNQKGYYSNKENYINVTGIITNVKYNDTLDIMYITLSDISPKLDDCCFKIVGENLKIVQKNGVDDKLELGKNIDFVTAPKYFGDGYVMPIVSLSVDGEELLSFEDGYSNFQTWLQNT